MTDVINQPRIDPRFLQRWVEVRRAEGRKRLRALVVIVVVLVVGALALGSLYTPLLKVRHVRIDASGPVTGRQVEALTGLDHYKLMVDVDATTIVRDLDSVPRLGGARVERRWPSTVAISVSVRTPLANVARPGGGWATVDATGRVLAYVARPSAGLPVLQGAVTAPAPGRWIDGSLGPKVVPGTEPGAALDMDAAADSATVPNGVAAALALLQALPASVFREAISVTVSSSGGLSMSVLPADVAAGSISVDFGDGSQLAAKAAALVTLLTQADLSDVGSIDLTVPDRPAALTAR